MLGDGMKLSIVHRDEVGEDTVDLATHQCPERAEVRPVRPTQSTPATGHGRIDQDAGTFGDPPGSSRVDDAADHLVAEHAWIGDRDGTRHDLEIGSADPEDLRGDQRRRPRYRRNHIFDGHAVHVTDDDGSHALDVSLPSATRASRLQGPRCLAWLFFPQESYNIHD
jgi:hypothetical protein